MIALFKKLQWSKHHRSQRPISYLGIGREPIWYSRLKRRDRHKYRNTGRGFRANIKQCWINRVLNMSSHNAELIKNSSAFLKVPNLKSKSLNTGRHPSHQLRSRRAWTPGANPTTKWSSDSHLSSIHKIKNMLYYRKLLIIVILLDRPDHKLRKKPTKM